MKKYKLLVLNTDEKDFSYGGVCPFMRNMHPFLEEAFDVSYLVLPKSWKKLTGSVRVKYLIYLWLHREQLKEHDFILSHSPEGSYVASFSVVPYAHVFHGNSNPMTISRYALGKFFKKMYDRMYERIDKTCAWAYTVGPPRNPMQRKLNNPLKQDVKPLPVKERKGFIFSGRLETMKNVDRLIRIYAKLPKEVRQENPFYIAGYGTQEASLHFLVRKMEDSMNIEKGQVLFLGNVDNKKMMETDACKKILLMASSTEGMPTAIAEAFSVGVPVVSTAVGDIPKVVVNGKNGELLPVEFEDEDYIAALMKVLDNYEMYGKNAYEASKPFNRETITRMVIRDIYDYLQKNETTE